MNSLLKILGKKSDGTYTVPGDKSISIRSIFISNIFHGDFELQNINLCEDVKTALRCMDDLAKDKRVLNCGNSATTMRLLTGLICGMYEGTDYRFKLIGDSSLSKRPMKRVEEPLNKMGFSVKTTNGHAPIYIKCIHNHREKFSYVSKVSSAQVKSCIELAAFALNMKLKYKEPVKSRNHTELMLKYFKNAKSHIYKIPGDFSTAAFLIANAIIYGSNIKIKDVGVNPTRIGFYKALVKMGYDIKFVNKRIWQNEPVADIIVKKSVPKFCKLTFDKKIVPSMIDEIPLLALICAITPGKYKFKDLDELRVKESDRLMATQMILDYIGPDDKKRLKALKYLQSTKDHRILLICKILRIKGLKYEKYINISIG